MIAARLDDDRYADIRTHDIITISYKYHCPAYVASTIRVLSCLRQYSSHIASHMAGEVECSESLMRERICVCERVQSAPRASTLTLPFHHIGLGSGSIRYARPVGGLSGSSRYAQSTSERSLHTTKSACERQYRCVWNDHAIECVRVVHATCECGRKVVYAVCHTVYCTL